MKKLLLLFWAVCLSSIVFAQNLYVLHVTGEILTVPENVAVKVGDKLPMDKQLKFSTAESKAIVMSRGKGRMLLDGHKSPKTESGEFVSIITEVMVPMKVNMKMSTRDLASYKKPETVRNLQQYFGQGAFAVIGHKAYVMLDEEEYPKESNQKLVYRYEVDGKAKVKEVPRRKNILLLSRHKMFEAHHKPTHGELFYVDKETKDVTPVAKLSPVFIDESELMPQVKALVNFYQADSVQLAQDSLYNNISAYIQETYGKTDSYLLYKWLSRHNILSSEEEK